MGKVQEVADQYFVSKSKYTDMRKELNSIELADLKWELTLRKVTDYHTFVSLNNEIAKATGREYRKAHSTKLKGGE